MRSFSVLRTLELSPPRRRISSASRVQKSTHSSAVGKFLTDAIMDQDWHELRVNGHLHYAGVAIQSSWVKLPSCNLLYPSIRDVNLFVSYNLVSFFHGLISCGHVPNHSVWFTNAS
jgi:hypothetical protein